MTKVNAKPRGYSDAIKSSFQGKEKMMVLASGDTAPLQAVLTVLHKNPNVNILAGVRAVCWSPDSATLASAGDAGPVYVCDVRFVCVCNAEMPVLEVLMLAQCSCTTDV